MKKSALTVGAVTLLGRGTGLAVENVSNGKVTKYKYRLKCTAAPETDDYIIAWSEATSAQAHPSSKQVRLNCSGPNKDETSSSALTAIEATITSSLLTGEATSTSINRLGILKDNPPPGCEEKDKYNLYDGGWLKSTDKQATSYRDRKLGNLPSVTTGVSYNLSGDVATVELVYAGFKFDGMTVGQGGITSNEKTFSTRNYTDILTEAEAHSKLGLSGEYGIGASTDLICEHLKIKADGSVGFSGSGDLKKVEDYIKNGSGSTGSQWQSTSNFSSEISGSGRVEWTIVLQMKTLTENYSDGVLLSSSETDWK